ncbi:hypothetical protein [Microvirga roseola]|uniref:hypothetical protein n=1 Tax=Microvirga roseola TaxID=2883126 RepID=UPI001E34D30D|nr:hypothetical protein [Microvirga roseola]
MTRPPMIPLLRFAGGCCCAVAAALLLASLWNGSLDAYLLLLAGAAGITGLSLFGFATNLVILHDIRLELRERGAPPSVRL